MLKQALTLTENITHLLDNNNKKGLTFTNDFGISNYADSYIIRSCFKHVNILNQRNTISISTDSELSCMNYMDGIDKITINIKTNYEVLDTNATSVNDKTYTWVITKNNYKNSEIYMKINKLVNSSSNTSNAFVSNFQLMYAIIVIVFLLVGFLIYKIFKKNSEEKNKI